jgi:hypothetical protein
MNTAESIRPSQASESPSFADLLTEFLPWARILLALRFVLLGLMLSGPFLFLVTIVVAFTAAASLIALAGTILATPYLLLRHVHRRLAEGRRSKTRTAPIPTVVARTALEGSR